MEAFKIFIVEDDKIFAKTMAHYLALNSDHDVTIFSNAKDCLKNLYKNPDMVSLDYSLPDLDGIRTLAKIKEFNPHLPVVIVSGQRDISTAVKLLKNGAYDYILKEENAKERLWNNAKNIREKAQLHHKITTLEQEVGKKYAFNNQLIGTSVVMQQIFALMQKATRTNITLSISGETGTGKEVVAKCVHYNSPRASAPFIPVNVTAIPSELIESELFGHEKGAFTGASNRRIGKFEEANHGTIFLDEIGDMDLAMQTKLLRVLQEEEVTRIGNNTPVKLDVRVIVATHKTLLDEVKKGNFREDLYYRILGLPIILPPLRERDNDVIMLARHFISEFCKKNKLPAIQLTTDAIHKLTKYQYPGNVRELKAIIELAVVMCDGKSITSHDITFSTTSLVEDLLSTELTLEQYELKIIRHFLNKYDNKVRLVAQKLGIGKTTIYRMIKEADL